MSFFEKLQEIEKLQAAIESHGKIPADTLRKVNYKFRLDWNYYSNMIEGNSLTMQETRGVMMNNITVEGKPLKDVLEMKGHDDVISEIMRIGKSELNISERRIKDIHKGIMNETYPDKKNQIGVWKTGQNKLINFRGEEYYFTTPADVPDAMHKLINWLNAEKEKIGRNTKDALHPAQIAFHFHIDYVTIHPFYDGNGRTARILTNLILISFGYPPIYVKDTEKDAYNQYLGEIQTYGGDTELFYTFMAGLLERSMNLTLDAIEGRMIDEPNDWQKKLQLFKLEKNKDDLTEQKNHQSIFDAVENSIKPLLRKTLIQLSAFEDLFTTREISFNDEEKSWWQLEDNNQLDSAIDFFRLDKTDRLLGYKYGYPKVPVGFYPFSNFQFSYTLSGFKRDGVNTFSVFVTLSWRFDEFSFLFFNNTSIEFESIAKLYHNNYNETEIEGFINDIGNDLYNQIESQIKKAGN